jgi:hypothetical protein
LGRARASRVAKRGAATTEPGLPQSNQPGNIAHSPADLADPLAAHWLNVWKMHPLALPGNSETASPASSQQPAAKQKPPAPPSPVYTAQLRFQQLLHPPAQRRPPNRLIFKTAYPHRLQQSWGHQPCFAAAVRPTALPALPHTSSARPGMRRHPRRAGGRWATMRHRRKLCAAAAKQPPRQVACDATHSAAVLGRRLAGVMAGRCTSAAPSRWRGAGSC